MLIFAIINFKKIIIMEYLVKDQIERYSKQRELALNTLINLNENLPFYDKKKIDLEIQIDKCDFKINELVMTVERNKNFELIEKNRQKQWEEKK